MSLSPCLNCETEYDKNNSKRCPSCRVTNEFVISKPSLLERWAYNKGEPQVGEVSDKFLIEESYNEYPREEPKSKRNLGQIPEIERLISAQNRTTHAVRAFVRFLFIQLSGISAAVILWNFSLASIDQQECFNSGDNCGANSFLQVAAVLVWLVSVIWSSIAGWSELESSEIR